MKENVKLERIIELVVVTLAIVLIPIILTAYIAFEWDACSNVWRGMLK